MSNRRQAAVQNVIDAFEAARLFNRDETVRLLDDADHRMVPRRRRTKAARIEFGKIVANRAENDPLLHVAHRRDQSFQISLGSTHQVKRETLSRLVPDAGQTFQLVNELSNWLGVL